MTHDKTLPDHPFSDCGCGAPLVHCVCGSTNHEPHASPPARPITITGNYLPHPPPCAFCGHPLLNHFDGLDCGTPEGCSVSCAEYAAPAASEPPS